jgi:hypothetical protein
MIAGLIPLATSLVIATAPAPRVPILVELFSSEGCSSCPAADAVLLDLDASQPVSGAEVVAVEFHVDYWNNLGWEDPFSQHEFTLRQERYAPLFDRSGVYTPQMIVDGSSEFVGSRASAAREAIAAAASRSHPAHIGLTRADTQLEVSVDQAPPGALVVAATTESNLSTQVEHGENAGRTLRHGPIARDLRLLGHVGADGRFHTVTPVEGGAHRRAVVFVQSAKDGQVEGTAVADLGTSGR